MKVKRKPTFLEAIIPVFAMLLLLGVGYGYYKMKAEPLLICAAAIAAIIAMRVGVSWDEMLEGIVEKLSKTMGATLILIIVGLLIGTWMISGTIPMMIYYGIKLVNPQFLLITAFLICAIVSTFTGTSWGTVGTMGVALMGIATGLGVSLPATAGAVVAGSYFGDKLSPLSDTTNLAPIAAGSELYEHIKHMMYTTIPAFIISIVVYGVVGIGAGNAAVATPEKVQVLLDTIDLLFKVDGINILLLLLPVAVVIYGSVTKKPTLPVMLTSAALAVILGIFVQGFTTADALASTVGGFHVSMAKHIQGFDPTKATYEVTRLLHRGGMSSMMGTLLLAYSAFGFGGIISKAGCLEVILEKILASVKSVGGLVTSTVLSCLTMALVTGSSYLSILIPGELFKDTYKARGLAAKNLSRTLEDSGTVVVPLVPWSMAGVYMATTLGVSVVSYAPWAILCYTGFIFAIIYGFTGFGIAKTQDSQVKTKTKEHTAKA